jgi:hypothetical protein
MTHKKLFYPIRNAYQSTRNVVNGMKIYFKYIILKKLLNLDTLLDSSINAGMLPTIPRRLCSNLKREDIFKQKFKGNEK